MASGPFQTYGKATLGIVNGSINLGTGTFKVALASTAYTPDVDAHDFWNDVSANEVTGTNWPAGGIATTLSFSQDPVANVVKVIPADVTVNTVTLTDAKHAILYKDTGNPATSPIIGYVTFDTALNPSVATLTIDFDGSTGALQFLY